MREPNSPPGWFPDPTGRFDHRWFNGERWTTDVAVDGTRYVDHEPTAPPPTSTGQRLASRRSGMATLTFVFGLASVVLGWTPFLFVFAAGGAVAAIVLGIVVLRRDRVEPVARRKMALAGLVLAPIGLASCVIGLLLTITVIHEFEDYLAPGKFTVTEESCTNDDGGLATFTGTIRNDDDRSRTYMISVEYGFGGEVEEQASLTVDGVAAGDTVEWTDRRFVGVGHGDARLGCRVRGVNGPFPFGLDPDR